MQAYDAGLSSLAGLTYASPSFIKVTATDVYAIRTIAETKADLGIDLSLYYLKTEIDTLGEIETIYSANITDSTELATALGDYYLKTAIDTQGEMETIWGVSLANDNELHAQNTDTDLDATFEATFAKKTDKLSAFAATSSSELAGVISDETGTGALVFANAPTIDFYNALASDHLYSGDIDSQPVGETVAFGQLLYFDWTDKEWKIAKADISTTMPGLRIALEAKNNGETCKMLVKGYIRDDSAFEFAGAMIYVSEAIAGAMTSTAPSTAGNQLQRVGQAKSADILFFDPSIDVGEI